MPLPPDLPIVDHHCHLSPSGEGVAAARRFRAAGGTHLFLATQNYGPGPPRSLADYARQFETTGALADRVRRDTGVVAYPVLAPYPVDLVDAVPALGADAALEIHTAAIDLAAKWVREGRAVALGEVGRPHFPVTDAVREVVSRAFDHALAAARDADCPVVVHSDDLDGGGYRALAADAGRAGLPTHRVVKHYARTKVAPQERGGIVPSYLARRELVAAALPDDAPWFLETDFLDDAARPGAVLDLATVPRRAIALADRSRETVDRLYVPFVESIERVYGWRPEPLAEARS